MIITNILKIGSEDLSKLFEPLTHYILPRAYNLSLMPPREGGGNKKYNSSQALEMALVAQHCIWWYYYRYPIKI